MTKEESLLDWLQRKPDHMLLESQVVGSGLSTALNNLLLAGKVDLIAHPTVKDRRENCPATAVVLKP